MQLVTRPEIAEDDPAARFLEDVLGLDVAMDQAGTMHGGERAAQLDAGPREVLGWKRTSGGELGLERLTLDELHPEAGAPIDALRPVDRGDVRMADPRHQPAFVHDEPVLGPIVMAQQLERDVAIEARVPGAIDVAEAPAADLLVDAEGAPDDRDIGGAGAIRWTPLRQKAADAHRRVDRELRVETRGFGDGPQLADRLALLLIGRIGGRRVPVGRLAVGNGFGQRGQSVVGIEHGQPLRSISKTRRWGRANNRNA